MLVAIFSFSAFLMLFVLIGLSSAYKSTNTSQDYLLASQNVKPWLVGLSAVATNNSGYMFIGMIGFTYATGLSSIWLMFGWITGDFIASLFIYRKLRHISERHRAFTFGELLSRWHGENYVVLRRLAGILTVLFLGTYAAAQLKAGSKALHVLFGWEPHVGAVIGSIIVVLYCFAGGLRASIWTDAAQSVVMLLAMLLLLVIAVYSLGGMSASIHELNQVGGSYMSWFPSDSPLSPVISPLLFVLGWLFAGFGVAGQPHIMVRYMAMNNADDITQVRFYYYFWFLAFYAAVICVGLLARVYIPIMSEFDEELALPTLAVNLMPDFLVGVVLAGLFAATISTADSLIISCSASITQDFSQRMRDNYSYAKLATIAVTASALLIAIYAYENVFTLVLLSWAMLAASFVPLTAIYALGQKPSQITALLMVISGGLTIIIWRYFGLSDHVYEIMPGITIGFIIYGCVKLLAKIDNKVKST